MSEQKYSVNQHLIETIVTWVKSGEIAIPEIQRPFVWSPSKVRDLMDSLYQGYPVGYIIAWRNPNVRLKDGSIAEGKRVLIDGQQRVTALTAAVLGHQVVDKDYRRINIKIGKKAPIDYFAEIQNQSNGGELKYGGITDMQDLMTNMAENCIPLSIFNMTHENYQEFIVERRMLIAKKIRKYYETIE